MPKIHVLSDVVASQIAAGEVVQRPASVVKELVDNSLDAGAGRILVEVEKGGNQSIRVVDDGCGMEKDDLPIALKRHATSKIELESDLQSIRTHGFRGEALAAISSVSKTEIVSRLQGERSGYRIYSEGGERVLLEPAGCPPGTSVTVADLFYNTPARRKFMKTPTTEMERVGEVVLRAALCHPNLHFELSHNGRRSRQYAPVPSRADRLVQVLGDNLTEDLLPVDYANDRIQIEGFASRPTTHRKTAADLYFFVNQRFIRDKILMRALSEAYRASLPQRRYPVVLLFIELPPDQVDVNVHPTKEEIRFSDEGLVWRSVYSAVREALSGLGEKTWIEVGIDEEIAQPAEREMQPSTNLRETPVAGTEGNPTRWVGSAGQEESRLPFPEPRTREFAGTRQEDSESGRVRANPLEGIPAPRSGFEAAREGLVETLNRRSLESGERAVSSADPRHSPMPASRPREEDRWKVVAQIFDSYVVCERREEVAIFDQHALHERIQFEKLRSQYEKGSVTQQTLMFPQTIEVAPNQVEILNGSLDLLSELGLAIEPFGDRTFIVRSVPGDLDLSEVEGLVSDALADLAEQGLVSPLSDRAEKILARMACRSAIKANERLAPSDLQHLIDQYSANPILSTCPHGRPPIWRLTRREIEKLFDRP